MKKICIITGSRAEYGLLMPLMQAVNAATDMHLQLIVTGMHLSPEFGLTYLQIEKDGFRIDEKVEMLLSADSDTSIIKSVGLGMIGFADPLNRLKPDLVVILGDRFEAFAAATAAYLLKIPIAHLHGGEVTEGATDEALRHAITKMSYLHFTSTDEYRNRVIQLGESPDRVFNVGAIGLDNIRSLKLLPKQELEQSMDFLLGDQTLLVTYHPVTLERQTAAGQMEELLQALNNFPEFRIVFTLPNADADGRIITKKIHDYAVLHPNRIGVFTSLGQLRYLSLLKFVSAVIGNSSSGIIEVPSFNIPTINIGNRQAGRLKPATVIDAAPDVEAITAAITKGLSASFQDWCKTQTNLYGSGDTTRQIMQHLRDFGNINSIQKSFHDIPLAI